MTFNQFAMSQLPPGALYRKSRDKARVPKQRCSQGVTYKDLPLVKKLIEMGHKEEAIALYRKIKSSLKG